MDKSILRTPISAQRKRFSFGDKQVPGGFHRGVTIYDLYTLYIVLSTDGSSKSPAVKRAPTCASSTWIPQDSRGTMNVIMQGVMFENQEIELRKNRHDWRVARIEEQDTRTRKGAEAYVTQVYLG